MRGSGRFTPGHSLSGALADIEALLAELRTEFAGLTTRLAAQDEGEPLMPAFEVAPTSPIVRALNRSYLRVRGCAQPTGATTPPAFYGTDAGHLFTKAGMEGVVCGPGGRYNIMPNERVDIAD